MSGEIEREVNLISSKIDNNIMDGRGVERGPLQLDIGIVVSGLGGNSNQERNQFTGLFAFFGVDLGLYIGP
jgi:hypothetical protein